MRRGLHSRIPNWYLTPFKCSDRRVNDCPEKMQLIASVKKKTPKFTKIPFDISTESTDIRHKYSNSQCETISSKLFFQVANHPLLFNNNCSASHEIDLPSLVTIGTRSLLVSAIRVSRTTRTDLGARSIAEFRAELVTIAQYIFLASEYAISIRVRSTWMAFA